jgi:[acyl-carrier-protein] S-malonyltransferase
MLSELYASFPLVTDIFQEASHALGYDLWKLIQQGSEAELNRTQITQPALLTAGYACWKVWQESAGDAPVLLSGHSLGEYTALVCAGVMEFSTAVKLVAERGRFMQEAVPEGSGGMAAILGLDDEKVVEICNTVSGDQVVAAANFNAPGQVVIAGHTNAVNTAMDAAKAAGARRAVRLPVSVPSHCALMREAADRLGHHLETIRFMDARIPVLQNVDGMERTDSIQIRKALLTQLYQPVQWRRSIMKMAETGITRIIECGPGKVLTGLCKRINRDLDAMALFDPASLQAALAGSDK